MANDDPRKKPKKKVDASHGKAKTGKDAAKAKKVAVPAAKVVKKTDKAKKVAVPAAKVDKKADKAKKVAGPAAKVDKKADKAKKVAGPAAKVDKKADKAKKVAKVGKNAGRAVGGDAGLAIALDAIEICDAVFEDRDDGVTAVSVAGEWIARVAEDADGAEEGTADDSEVGTDMKSIISCLTCCIRGTMAAAKAAEAIGDAAVCQKCGTQLKIGKNKGGKSRLCPKCAKR